MTQEKPRIGEEVRLIPWWAFGLALLLFAGIQAAFHVIAVRTSGGPPVALRIYLGLVFGTILASVVMLVGYVNRDAKRRNMNSTLWTVLVIFIPNAIGFIIYFLLRQPLMMKCPQCEAAVKPDFNYCPKCKNNLRPTCPKCAHVVRPGDAFCPQCAYELKEVSAA